MGLSGGVCLSERVLNRFKRIDGLGLNFRCHGQGSNHGTGCHGLFDRIVDCLSEGFSIELGESCPVLIDRGTFRRSVGIRVACLTPGRGNVDKILIFKVGTADCGSGAASRAATADVVGVPERLHETTYQISNFQNVIFPINSGIVGLLEMKAQLQRHKRGERRTLLVEIATIAALLCERA
jgi:hypothetical protein